MNFSHIVAIFFVFSFFIRLDAVSDTPYAEKSLLDKPLVERYILDELKDLRKDQQQLSLDVTEKITYAQLNASDRAIRYTADTTNNIFYIITAAASLLVLIGWKSLRDIKDNIEKKTMAKIAKLIDNYEQRLVDLEQNAKLRSDQLIQAQIEISNTNKLHSLWMRAGIEKNDDEKILLYNEILELKPDDVAALTHKADTLLDIGQAKWALSLSNHAIELDPNYALAYWQRACANADLGDHSSAIDDIEMSLKLTPSFVETIEEEGFFKRLIKEKRLQSLISSYKNAAN